MTISTLTAWSHPDWRERSSPDSYLVKYWIYCPVPPPPPPLLPPLESCRHISEETSVCSSWVEVAGLVLRDMKCLMSGSECVLTICKCHDGCWVTVTDLTVILSWPPAPPSSQQATWPKYHISPRLGQVMLDYHPTNGMSSYVRRKSGPDSLLFSYLVTPVWAVKARRVEITDVTAIIKTDHNP